MKRTILILTTAVALGLTTTVSAMAASDVGTVGLVMMAAKTAAQPGGPLKGIDVRVDRTSGAIQITLPLTPPRTWAYDPKTGSLTPAQPTPQEAVNPVKGVGVVIKKNPGGAAERTAPVTPDQVDLSTLSDGDYDVTIQIPADATPDGQAKSVTITITKSANTAVYKAGAAAAPSS